MTKETRGGISREYGYDALGRIIWNKDGKSQKTQYTFDSFSNITKITYCNGTTKENQYNYNENYVIMKNEMNKKIKYDYDPAGNLESISDMSEYNTNELEKYEYDERMRLKKKISLNTDKSCETEYTYDGMNRLKTEKVTENGLKVLSEKEYGYSYFNYVYKETVLLKGDENSDDIKSCKSYDLAGHLKSESIYNNNSEKTLMEYSYDYLGVLTKSTKYSDKNEVLNYTSDYSGQVIKIKYADGVVKESLSYDMLGRMLTHKDGNGSESNYSYAENSRVTEYSVPFYKSDNTTYKSYIKYSYDSNDNVTMIAERNSLPINGTPPF